MSQPFVGEIRMFGGNFAPLGWELCHGQLLPIAENEVLFQLIGTTYGGDGQSTFAMPDLRGRIPVHQGTGSGLSNRIIGETGGAEQTTLNATQIPAHSHTLTLTPQAMSSAGKDLVPTGNYWAKLGGENAYGDTPNVQMAAGLLSTPTLGSVGGNQPHTNMPPFLAVNFIISLFGIYPSPI